MFRISAASRCVFCFSAHARRRRRRRVKGRRYPGCGLESSSSTHEPSVAEFMRELLAFLGLEASVAGEPEAALVDGPCQRRKLRSRHHRPDDAADERPSTRRASRCMSSDVLPVVLYTVK